MTEPLENKIDLTQLETNYTTVEQSKKLMELGIPEDTADCYYRYYQYHKDEYPEGPIVLSKNQTFSKYCGTGKKVDENLYTPCWSTGRLIEIYLKCCDATKFYRDKPYVYLPILSNVTVLEQILGTIELDQLNGHQLAFSKLYNKKENT